MKKEKLIILIIVIAGMVGWSVYQFVSSSDDTAVDEQTKNTNIGQESNDIGLSKGDKAPDFELTTLNGDKIRLSDYEDQRVIVNFWASWCGPCREEIPDLQKLYDNKDVEILAVNLTGTEKSKDNVRDFVNEYEMSFPKPMDEDGKVAEKYEVAAYPTSYMIDSDGIIQYIAMGPMPYEVMTERLAKID